ncbi:MAG: hypothetical protein JXA69_13900 [Phycisphaerae bacterium]|nr:hypothetical protein [Phycisphaerae bacterium]
MRRTVHSITIARLIGNPILLLVAGIAVIGCGVACRDETPQRARAAALPVAPTSATPVPVGAMKKVLVVHSYHKGYPWVDAITQGVQRALAGSPVQVEIVYMDTKRKPTEAWKRQSGDIARQVVAEWQPDVVITSDDNAQAYFAKDYAGRDRPQFVFCGVNAEPGEYGYPADNITGILERPHFAATLEILSRLMPAARRIAIVTDDSETSTGALKFMTRQPARYLMVSVETPSTFEQWQAAIRGCQTTADAIAVYMYHTVKPTGGSESMPPKDVMAWTVENSRIPIIGFFIFTVDDGALCGFLESGVEHGFRAGRMAMEILDGKKAKEIPLVTALEGQSMLNMAAAKRYGIEVSDLARESIEIVIGD